MCAAWRRSDTPPDLAPTTRKCCPMWPHGGGCPKKCLVGTDLEWKIPDTYRGRTPPSLHMFSPSDLDDGSLSPPGSPDRSGCTRPGCRHTHHGLFCAPGNRKRARPPSPAISLDESDPEPASAEPEWDHETDPYTTGTQELGGEAESEADFIDNCNQHQAIPTLYGRPFEPIDYAVLDYEDQLMAAAALAELKGDGLVHGNQVDRATQTSPQPGIWY